MYTVENTPFISKIISQIRTCKHHLKLNKQVFFPQFLHDTEVKRGLLRTKTTRKGEIHTTFILKRVQKCTKILNGQINMIHI